MSYGGGVKVDPRDNDGLPTDGGDGTGVRASAVETVYDQTRDVWRIAMGRAYFAPHARALARAWALSRVAVKRG